MFLKIVALFIPAILVVIAIILSFVVALFPAWILRLCGKKEAFSKWISIHAHILSCTIFGCLGIRTKVVGKENIPTDGRRILFVGNHQSLLDPVMIFGPGNCQPSIIAKKEIQKAPIIKQWAEGLGCIFMDRTSPRTALKAILDGIEHLKTKGNLLVFPEGTRSKDGKIHEFKAGSFKLATKSKCTIVPFVIEGTRNALESRRRIGLVHATLRFLPAINVAELDEEQIKALPETVTELVRQNYNA